MSKVDESKRAQSREQQRLQQQRTKAELKQSADRFARRMNEKKAEIHETSRADQLQKTKAVHKRAGQDALMARSGIAMANKFQGMLHTAGKQSVQNGREAVKNRQEDLKDTEAQQQELDGQQSLREAQKHAEQVEAIDHERGRGGGDKTGGGGDDQDQEGGTPNQAAVAVGGTSAAQRPAEVQGGTVPLPPHIVQEIVKRVMVGMDKEGMSHFVIQLKDDVLGGATLQITAKDGKIAAKFTTRDKNAGRLIKASEGALARAFAHKGMSLESFTVGSDPDN